MHHPAGSAVFLRVGVTFAVLLAFVFSRAWGEYNQALAALDLKVGAMHGVATTARTPLRKRPDPPLSKSAAIATSALAAFPYITAVWAISLEENVT